MSKEAECLVPVAACHPQQVVLVGDHKQLQPIVLNKTAEGFGLDRSLFERYAEQAIMLTTQYRMVRNNKRNNNNSNICFNSTLQCGHCLEYLHPHNP